MLLKQNIISTGVLRERRFAGRQIDPAHTPRRAV